MKRDVLQYHGVATCSRLLQIIGLFCKRALWKRRYFAKETYNLEEPTNRSHPIPAHAACYMHIMHDTCTGVAYEKRHDTSHVPYKIQKNTCAIWNTHVPHEIQYTCAIWNTHVPYETQEFTCAIWNTHVPYETQESTRAIWNTHVPYETQEFTCAIWNTHVLYETQEFTCAIRNTAQHILRLLDAHMYRVTTWRRLIGCLKLQVIFCKRATNYRALVRKMTYKDKPSYASSPPCSRTKTRCEKRRDTCVTSAHVCWGYHRNHMEKETLHMGKETYYIWEKRRITYGKWTSAGGITKRYHVFFRDTRDITSFFWKNRHITYG